MFSLSLDRLLIVVALSMLTAAGATWFVTSRSYEVVIANQKADKAESAADNATASLDQLKAFIGNMNAATTGYNNTQGVLYGKIDDLAKDLKNAQSKAPLPVDCKPDADRLRSLAATVSAVNAAAAGQ